jgi:hypothetical protein
MKSFFSVVALAGLVLLVATLSASLRNGARIDSLDAVQVGGVAAESEGVSMGVKNNLDKSRYQLAPDIHSQIWLNGAPTSLAEQRGRVVLIDFWTFG